MRKNFDRDYARAMLRSEFVSMFVSALKFRKQRQPEFGVVALAKTIGKDKATLSRDLGGSPNWGLDTVSDLANALQCDLLVELVDRETGARIRATGPVPAVTRTEDVLTRRALQPLKQERVVSFGEELAA